MAPPVCEWSRRFRAARAYAGFSQAELADLLGVGTTTVKRYEAADRPPAATKRVGIEQRMVEACGVPAAFFADAVAPFAAIPEPTADQGELIAQLAALVEALDALRPGAAGDVRRQLGAEPDPRRP